MVRIANSLLSLAWNESGELVEFSGNNSSGTHFQKHPVCRLILGRPDLLEFEVRPAGKCTVESRGNTLKFYCDSTVDDAGNCYATPLTLSATLDGDEVRWGVEAENHTDSAIIREIHYPIFSLRDPEPPMRLHTAELVSSTCFDLPAMLRSKFTHYMAPDQKYVRHTAIYPGRAASMNYFLLDYGEKNFYFGCHDPEFALTVHGFEQEKGNTVNCFMARLPFLKPGKRFSEAVMTTSLLDGNWTCGCRKYRKWADTWFTPPKQTGHIQNSFGWQRVIMHHQYGEYFFHYSDLPKLLADGLPAGLDTIFLFGWTQEGMDSGYPAYTPDPACGGFDELRKNILKVREMGGHVIIYYNGQLIDCASDYFRHGGGQQVSIKRMDGTEHREFYNFSSTGTFTRDFGNKTFAVACPACREWIDIQKAHVDQAFALGADGVFFDQLGLASYPCCDPTHGHEVPFIGLMKAKMEMLHELRDYAKSKSPDFSIGVECPTDQTSQYCDFVHIFGNTAQVWNRDFRQTGTKPLLKSAAPLFRTTFPEVYLSDRDIRDDSDVEFPVNVLVLLGRRTDAEVYRCRASLAAAPKYQKYLALANQLRNRYKELLLHGTPVAENCHHFSDPLILTNAFQLGNNLAVVATQSSQSQITASLEVPGYRFVEYASIRNDAVFQAGKLTLPKDSLAVLLFEK